MTLNRERRAYALFQQTFDRAPSERAAFLERACAADLVLRAEVEDLLRLQGEMGGFLARPAVESVARTSPLRVPEIGPGAEVGSYRVVRALGGGASGSVYEAMQARPHRRVALKVLRAGFASQEARRRFLDEAEVLARLDHAGIARIFEAGVHRTQGVEVPFFALEYVEDARPISVYATEEGLSARERIELVADVCDAVHHGHQKGVLHRDLKPANLLVDGRGRVKVIDFGIARDVARDGGPGGLVGTVAYMSPEQADPDCADLDVRSDVFALGVVLHELLTGRPLRELSGLSLSESLDRVRSAPAAEPLRRVNSDVEAVLGRTLARRREDRYASVAALGDDLRRHLGHRPVEAAAGGALDHLSKFARRQPVASAALVAVVTVSVVGGVVGARLAYEKERQRRTAEFQAYVANVAAASSALALDDVAGAREHLGRAPSELRNFEWRHLAAGLDASERTLRWEGRAFRTGAVDAGGRTIVASGMDASDAGPHVNGVRAWDVASGAVRWTIDTGNRRADALALSPDAELLAVGYQDGSLELRDGGSGSVVASLGGHGEAGRPARERHVNAAAFEPGGRWLATASGDGTVRLWEAPSGRPVATLDSGGVRVICLALLRGGERVAAGLYDGSVVVWNTASRAIERRIPAHDQSVDGIAVSPDGTRLVSSSRDRTARVWDLADGSRLASISVHADNVRDVAFSPSGDVFATASWDRTLALFRTSDGSQLARLRGHADWVERVAFLPGGERLVSFSREGTIKTWRADVEHGEPLLRGHADAVTCVAGDPSGRWLVSVSGPFERSVRVWDLRSRAVVGRFERGVVLPSSLALWPDGSRFAVADVRRPVEVRSLPGASALAGPAGALGPVALSRDGALLCGLGDRGATIVTWRTDTWAQVDSWDAEEPVAALALSPDGRTLAVSSDAGTLTLRDTRTHEVTARERTSPRAAVQIEFAPTGELLAVCNRTAAVRLHGARDLSLIATLGGHAAEVNAVAFSPDGTRIATASRDATVRLWDTATFEPVTVLDTRRHPALCVAFLDGGRVLACGAGVGEAFGEVRLWSAPDLPAPR